jgi:2'-5' RNA ligase
MRLFVAIDLNDSVRAAIAQYCGKLRIACSSAKWVRPEGMHITLKFIGEMSEDRVDGILSALKMVRSTSQVDMSLRGVGFFPNEHRPRVFWAGIHASPNLAEIAHAIESKLEPLKIPKEAREFKPHLTLARIDELRGLDKLRDAIKEADDADFGAMQASEMHLYKSELARGGAKYTRMGTFKFASAA